MKKIITLLSLLMLLVATATIAQPGTVCNAGFSFQVNGNNVQFISTGTIAAVPLEHRWFFGDGGFANTTSGTVTHQYAAPGAYVVLHEVTYRSPNDSNVLLCADSAAMTVLIGGPAGCNLNAFIIYARDSTAPNTFHFANQSGGTTPNTLVRWSFGDGTSSTESNPSHTYLNSGNYTVCLRVQRDSLCFDDTCITVQVQAPNPCNLTAGFSSRRDSTNSYKYYFTNLSAPVSVTDTIRYSFGDGSSSFEANPTHTYNAPGIYNVCIRVKKATVPGTPPCIREYCQSITVQAPPAACNLHASIAYSRDSSLRNQFYFSSQSAGTTPNTMVTWNFGDGGTSNQPNISYAYTTPGTYQVCLRVQRDSACFSDTCIDVVAEPVTTQCSVNASFNAFVDSTNASTIHFVNHTIPFAATDSISWYFGDGGYSTDINPTHSYLASGIYNVCIRVSVVDSVNNRYCYANYCSNIVVTADSCQLSASFTSRADSVNGRKIYFTNTSTAASNAIATWTFGDGTAATGWNSNHVYASNGRYAVCLTVTAGNCTSITCDSVVVIGNVPPVNCDNKRLEYVYRRDSYLPNKFYFFAVSNGVLTRQTWTFKNFATGVVLTDSQPNPIHTFADTGYYQVCVAATFSNGCVKQFCDNIRVNSTTAPAQCVLQTFPNPAHNHVAVNLQLQAPTPIVASIFNTQNVLVLTRTQQGFTGNNLVQFNIGSLTPGFYTIRLMHGNKVCYARFQKF